MFKKLIPGDLIIFKGRGFLASLIGLVTKSQYTHAGIYYGEIRKKPFYADASIWGVKLNRLDLVNLDSYDVYRVKKSSDFFHKIQIKIINKLDMAYDYEGLFGITLVKLGLATKNIFQNTKKNYCSELCAMIHKDVFKNTAILSPGDLAVSEFTTKLNIKGEY